MHDTQREAERLARVRQHSVRGRPSRLLLAAACCGVAAAANDWHVILAVPIVAAVIWELVGARFVDAIADRAAAKHGPEAGLRWVAFGAFVGTLIYASYAVIVMSFGNGVSAYMSMAWLMGALLHAFVYFSKSPLLLIPQGAVNGALLLAHPFLFLSDPVHAALAALTLALLIGALAQFAVDRNALLDAVATREREKRAADQANEAKSQFLASMSHELRTPLNAILGYAEMIEEEHGAADATLRDDARRISHAGKHLLGLINEVLDMARLDANEVHIEATRFDVRQWANDTAAMIQPLARKNGNVFQLAVADDVGHAHTDESRLRQCLLNLAGNACKFTHNGLVTVSIAAQGDDLELKVSDTGIGISEENQPKLFQPFQQGDPSIAQRFGGTGLGLSITRRLVELLGGGVRVESKLGHGSTFTITVPRSLAGEDRSAWASAA